MPRSVDLRADFADFSGIVQQVGVTTPQRDAQLNQPVYSRRVLSNFARRLRSWRRPIV